MFASILILSPLLLVFTFKENQYPIFWKLARIISKILIYGMGFRLDLTAEQEIEPN